MLESRESEGHGQSQELHTSKWKESSLCRLMLSSYPRRARGVTVIIGTAHMFPRHVFTARSSQHEILEDYAELFGLFVIQAALRDAFFAILGTIS